MATDAEQAVRDGLEAAEEIGKRVLRPDVRRLDELFSKVERIGDLHGYRSRPVHVWTVDDWRTGRRGGGRAELSSFCAVHGRPYSLDVEPRPELVGLISREMMICDDYRISFKVVVRSGGTALVCAEYNQITGGRWLAIVPASEVPPRAG